MDKKRSPKKRKSTRRPCPLDIDCELVAAERGKVCPNRDYCEHVAAPWNLPFRATVLPDGTQVLTVITSASNYSYEGTQSSEQYKAGWCAASLLPFYYFKIPEFSRPILVVYRRSFVDSGWEEAKHLGTRYHMWAAATIGISYQDFYEKDFDSYQYFDCWQYPVITEPQSDYPHCILPPDF